MKAVMEDRKKNNTRDVEQRNEMGKIKWERGRARQGNKKEGTQRNGSGR